MSPRHEGEPVEAVNLFLDAMYMLSAQELLVLSMVTRHHRDVSAHRGRGTLASFWSMLGMATDAVITAHPNILSDTDREFLDSLGMTGEPGHDGEPA